MLKTYKESDGILTVLDFIKLPFIPVRAFWVRDVPEGDRRGNHAHHKGEQYLICVQGKIWVRLFDGREYTEEVLDPHDEGVFVPKMVWNEYLCLAPNSILLSFCSNPYDPDDYINDLEEFKRIANG